MKIEHIALWTSDLEKMKDFYLNFFELESNWIYWTKLTPLQSRFSVLSFWRMLTPLRKRRELEF